MAKIKTKHGYTLLIVFILLFIFSCKNDKPIDISNDTLETSLYRFDEIITQSSPVTANQWAKEKENHPEFISIFSEAVLGDTSAQNLQSLNQFRQYFDTLGVNQKVKEEFNSFPELKAFNNLQKRLTASLSNYKPIDITTMISGFNYKNTLLDNQIAIGLEWYLDDKIDYLSLGELVNEYQIHRFNRDYIVPDVATAIIDDLHPDRGEFNTFLKKIIYEGKKLYIKEQALPRADKEILIGLPTEKYQWCVDNEKIIWQYFIREELLYSNDLVRWKSYVFDGPFSAGMPEEAPSLTGNYVGWNIVKSYMNTHKKTTIDELLKLDAADLFKAAKYSP